MIICQIITTLVYGGAERLLVNFSNILVQEHEIHIVYLKGEPKLKSNFDSKIMIHHVPLGINVAARLRKLLKAINPAVVHTHLGHADLIGMWASRGLPSRLYCTMHNVYFKWNWMDNLFFLFYAVMFKTYGKRCHVSCISTAVAEHTHKKLGVSKKQISVNYNAVPDLILRETKTQARKELSLNDGDFCVLAIGRLRVQKSIETLLEAVALIKNKIPELRILIVGEGELEQELKALTLSLNIESVVSFCGGTKNPERYFSAADVFVLSSVFEGLPTVVLEAFRSSIPVVASNIDGTNELIDDQQNGFLFPVKDSKALAEILIKLYHTPVLREQVGALGNASYKSKFDIHNYAKQMNKLYLQ